MVHQLINPALICVLQYIGSFSVTGADEDARARQVETQLESLRVSNAVHLPIPALPLHIPALPLHIPALLLPVPVVHLPIPVVQLTIPVVHRTIPEVHLPIPVVTY